jgi:hypothetical protein
MTRLTLSLAALAATLTAGPIIIGIVPAVAADLPARAQAAAPVPSSTTQNCTGFYLGAHIEGEGSNADKCATLAAAGRASWRA